MGKFDFSERYPKAYKLTQRRMLVTRSTYGVVDPLCAWIDDDDSCEKTNCRHTYWSYNEYGLEVMHAIRCPRSLTEDERRRIITDIPEGTYPHRLADFLRENGRLGHQYAKDETFKPGSSKFLED